jgi:hypothetical protein
MDVRTPVGRLLTLDEIRQRLAALTAELKRLERDRTVFARAFHTHVAQAVYAALIEDEARLAALPSLELTLDEPAETTPSSSVVDEQSWSTSGPARRAEILDL